MMNVLTPISFTMGVLFRTVICPTEARYTSFATARPNRRTCIDGGRLRNGGLTTYLVTSYIRIAASCAPRCGTARNNLCMSGTNNEVRAPEAVFIFVMD